MLPTLTPVEADLAQLFKTIAILFRDCVEALNKDADTALLNRTWALCEIGRDAEGICCKLCDC